MIMIKNITNNELNECVIVLWRNDFKLKQFSRHDLAWKYVQELKIIFLINASELIQRQRQQLVNEVAKILTVFKSKYF